MIRVILSVILGIAVMIVTALWLMAGRHESSVINESASGTPTEAPPASSIEDLRDDSKRVIEPERFTTDDDLPDIVLRESVKLDKPTESIAEVYDDLVNSARAGDGEAAVRLYKALYHCSGIPSSRQDLDAQIHDIETTGMYGGRYWEDTSGFIEKLEDDFRYCDGLSVERRARYYDWMVLAADIGELQAQLDFAVVAPPGIHDIDPATATPGERERIDKARAASMHYLGLAVEQGSIEAMNWMALSYHQGVMVERDPAKAYSYMYAVVAAQALANANKSFHLGLLEMFENQLLPHQLEEARRKGAAMLANPACCVLDRK